MNQKNTFDAIFGDGTFDPTKFLKATTLYKIRLFVIETIKRLGFTQAITIPISKLEAFFGYKRKNLHERHMLPVRIRQKLHNLGVRVRKTRGKETATVWVERLEGGDRNWKLQREFLIELGLDEKLHISGQQGASENDSTIKEYQDVLDSS